MPVPSRSRRAGEVEEVPLQAEERHGSGEAGKDESGGGSEKQDGAPAAEGEAKDNEDDAEQAEDDAAEFLGNDVLELRAEAVPAHEVNAAGLLDQLGDGVLAAGRGLDHAHGEDLPFAAMRGAAEDPAARFVPGPDGQRAGRPFTPCIGFGEAKGFVVEAGGLHGRLDAELGREGSEGGEVRLLIHRIGPDGEGGAKTADVAALLRSGESGLGLAQAFEDFGFIRAADDKAEHVAIVSKPRVETVERIVGFAHSRAKRAGGIDAGQALDRERSQQHGNHGEREPHSSAQETPGDDDLFDEDVRPARDENAW